MFSYNLLKEGNPMQNNKIVVALGRNCFGDTFPEQKKNVTKAARAIADLVEEKYRVIVTHSNGAQIGMIQTAMTEFSRLDSHYTTAPVSLCGAMSQGYIGYDLQNSIRSELLTRGIYKTVSTIITQVRVDPFDKAFNNPTKIIGRHMSKEDADIEEEKGNHVISDGDNGYRRIIASPKPIDIYEIDAIRALTDAGQIVIAAGGGGIPVLEQGVYLKGASAIIEKDYTAAKLADMLDASRLLFLTETDCLTINRDTDNEQKLGKISVSDALELTKSDHFEAITTQPKMEASIAFVSAKEERTAIITHVDKVLEGIREKAGTIIKS